MEKIESETCPICLAKELVLNEDELEIPFFGKVYLFSMHCNACGFHKGDVEAAEMKDPCRIIFTTEKEDDMNIRVVKSSEATLKIPQLKITVTPGPASEGYVSNIEGMLTRIEKVIADERDSSDDESAVKTAKNLLKKIRKVKYGEIPLKIIIEDPSGNSAIISEKATIEKLKVSKKK